MAKSWILQAFNFTSFSFSALILLAETTGWNTLEQLEQQMPTKQPRHWLKALFTTLLDLYRLGQKNLSQKNLSQQHSSTQDLPRPILVLSTYLEACMQIQIVKNRMYKVTGLAKTCSDRIYLRITTV